MVISILDQYLVLLDFSLPSMISITDIEPNNYSKLAKEGFRLKKLQFSHQGHFLCFLAADSEQRSALFLMEIAQTVSHIIPSQSHVDLYQIKEIRERVKSRVIKDFSTYEKGEDSNQLHSVLLLEGGEVVSMSLCTNCSNKFKKSVIKELMDIASTALISIGFLILFIFARTVMASHIDEETEEI